MWVYNKIPIVSNVNIELVNSFDKKGNRPYLNEVFSIIGMVPGKRLLKKISRNHN